jgi:peroxiredoxin
LRQDYGEFRQRDAEVIAIGAGALSSYQRHWAKEQVPFPALPNPRKDVLRLYGQQFKWLKFGRMPAVIVVDKHGYVRFQHHGNSQSDIPENQVLLDVIDRLNSEDIRE